MVSPFAPVGSALPARRDQTMTAAGPMPAYRNDSIVVPMARDRALEIFDRVQRPASVADTLDGSLLSDLAGQQMLFQAMLDTWPRLQKAMREIKLRVRKAPWKVEPWARRGEKAAPPAEKAAKELEEIIWGMKPDPIRGTKGFEGMVEELATGYFLGHHVLEPRWTRRGGKMVPETVLPVPPRFYGYPPTMDEQGDRLMLDPNGGRWGSASFEDFPEHRFLIAVNGGHSGHPAQAAPLRALTGYWLGAVFGLKWLMQYAQLFGVPFRWATYPAGDNAAKAELKAMMANIGSQGWAAFQAGTTMEFLDNSKGGSSLVQRDLLTLADEQCDVFMLGQTLSSSQGDRGSQSLGEVHMEVRNEVIEGVCDFVGEILTHQLVPAIAHWNGVRDGDKLPGIWAKFDKPKDEKGMAERDKSLGLLDGTMPVERKWLYERHNVPLPAEGAALFKDKADPVAPPPRIGPDGKPVKGLPVAEKVEARYDPNQPRDPGGEGGGRWVDSGRGEGLGKGEEATRGKMRPGTEDDRKRLKVPPAYKNLMVSDEEGVDLVGVAEKPDGSGWPVYSEEYTRRQQDAKWGRVAELDGAYDDLAARMDEDIEAAGTDAGPAAALRLIRQTGMRNGGEGASMVPVIGPDGVPVKKSDGKPLKRKITTYGASSLRGKHITVTGDTISLEFPGKKGVLQKIEINDPVLARVMRPAAGKDVKVFKTNDDTTRDYLTDISGGRFKVHDFRTLHATLAAESAVNDLVKSGAKPQNPKDFEALKRQVAKPVSEGLGNTPAVALTNYIHPDIFRPLQP